MKATRLFVPRLAGASLSGRLVACIGAALGIALTAVVCGALPLLLGVTPLLMAPLGASAVLLFAVPSSPLAQPWSIVGGNIVSAVVGVGIALIVPYHALAAGLAVGLAILAMSLARCLHPPGGAVALIAVIGGPAVAASGYAFALVPVALNSLLLAFAGWLFHRVSGHSYPHRAAIVASAVPDPLPAFHPNAIDLALADLGEAFDLSRDDLDLLLQRAEYHEARRRGRG